MRSSHSTASMAMGYFLDGTNYNTIQTAWGGWYIAEYYKPSYVSIANGTWTQNEILTAASYDDYALPLTGGTLTGDLYIDKSSGDTGVFVQNTTKNHQIGLIIGGSSGYGGIYDVTQTKWIIYNDTNGYTQTGGSLCVNGNLFLQGPYHYYTKYNNSDYVILYNHNNGNISLRACGGGLYIGYESTTLVDILHNRATFTLSNTTPAVCHFTTSGNISAGTYAANTAQSAQYNVFCQGGAGTIYLFSEGSITGNRGIYSKNSAGTNKYVIKVKSDNTAEFYGIGTAEKTFGQALKELNVPREKIIVSIKIFKNGFDPNDGGEGRKHIIEGVKQSLKNLQLDYADIVFAHRYDMNTPKRKQ